MRLVLRMQVALHTPFCLFAGLLCRQRFEGDDVSVRDQSRVGDPSTSEVDLHYLALLVPLELSSQIFQRGNTLLFFAAAKP